MLIPIDLIALLGLIATAIIIVGVPMVLILYDKHPKLLLVLSIFTINAMFIFVPFTLFIVKPKFLYGECRKIEGVERFYDKIEAVDVYDVKSKEAYYINFSPMAIGHKVRIFYDVPRNNKQYVKFKKGGLAYGNVEFHKHER